MIKVTIDRALIEQAIAGAIFDFAGYLTSHPDTIEVGSVANAAVIVERIRAWAGYSGLSIENANVEKWNATLAEPAVEPYAWVVKGTGLFIIGPARPFDDDVWQPVYTSAPPPPAEVPLLSNKEIHNADPHPHIMFDTQRVEFARAIEQLVRRKAGL